MSQITQAPRRTAQIDFMPMQANSNRFRAMLLARRFGLLRAWLAINA